MQVRSLPFSSLIRCMRRFGPLAGLRVGLQLRRLRRLPAGRTMTIGVPGLRSPVTLRSGTSDLKVFDQLFLCGEQDIAFATPPATIVDAGANIGLASILLANRYPAARIVALEVEAGNFALLRTNTAAYPNVLPLRLGLWTHRTHLRIENPGGEQYGFRVVEANGPAGDTIEAAGVDDVMALANLATIDLLKIDIEGAELEVFTGNAGRWLDRVGTLMVELHEELRPGCTSALHAATRPHGFTPSRHGEYVVLARSRASSTASLP